MYSREGSVNFMSNNNYNNNNNDISHSTDKKPKSLKNQNFSKIYSSIINNNSLMREKSRYPTLVV